MKCQIANTIAKIISAPTPIRSKIPCIAKCSCIKSPMLFLLYSFQKYPTAIKIIDATISNTPIISMLLFIFVLLFIDKFTVV